MFLHDWHIKCFRSWRSLRFILLVFRQYQYLFQVGEETYFHGRITRWRAYVRFYSWQEDVEHMDNYRVRENSLYIFCVLYYFP